MRIPVDGGEIWAEASNNDRKSAVVLLHPGWGDADIWLPLLPLLNGRYRTVRYDDRAYGRSPAPAAPFTRVADLRAVLDHLAVERPVIVAHSGSGGTALALLLDEPDRAAALVLVAPGCADYPWPETDPYVAAFEAAYTAGDRPALIELGLRTWARADPGARARKQVTSAVTAFLATGDLELPEPPVFPRLGEVRVRTVMVRGDREYPMVADASDQIAARIPGCERVVVNGADHLLPLQAPDRLAQLIRELGPARPS